ncbi:starch-binding protein, partial [Parabacteroides distasonis]|nr:starch-binding protein [Parabacteroides distasonis]
DQYYAIIKETFKLNKENSYAKQAFIQHLKNKYSSIGNLNNAWGTSIASWEVLEQSYSGTIGKEDCSEMLSSIADKYYKTVNEAVKKYLPNILYIGSRLAEWGTSIEVQQACAQYVDVMSFNCYKTDINQDWMNFGAYDKPIIIGEFHFNAMDHGYFAPGLVPVEDQQARADAYEKYMQSVYKNDNFVGAQWFQYYDQPILGRAWDGENTNAGFVDVADEPYKELVEAAKRSNYSAYDLKYNRVSISSISLNQNNVILNDTKREFQLNAAISPSNADNTELTWKSSNPTVATVDETGKVSAVDNGTTIITVTSKANPAMKATCEVIVTGLKNNDEITFPKLSFEGDDVVSHSIGGHKDANTEVVSTSATDGNYALEVTGNSYDQWGNFGSIDFTSPDGTWNIGKGNPLKMDITNPNDTPIQVRSNVMDENNHTRTYYFTIPANSTRTIEIKDFAAGPDSWGDDGYFGAADTGIDSTKIKFISAFAWADPNSNPETPLKFIIDNIKSGGNLDSSEKMTFPKVSFEDDEDILYKLEGLKQGTLDTIADKGVTDGSSALKLTIDSLNTEDNGNVTRVDFAKDSGTWSLGKDGVLKFDLTNSNNYKIQARVNITDENSVTRTYYYSINPNDTRNIEINNFDKSSDIWETDGLFGAPNGIDKTKIKSISMYVWEADPGLSNPCTIIIDNLRAEKADTSGQEDLFTKAYFKNIDNWEDLKAYIRTVDKNGNLIEELEAWPGVPLKSEGDDLYSYELPKGFKDSSITFIGYVTTSAGATII